MVWIKITYRTLFSIRFKNNIRNENWLSAENYRARIAIAAHLLSKFKSHRNRMRNQKSTAFFSSFTFRFQLAVCETHKMKTTSCRLDEHDNGTTT